MTDRPARIVALLTKWRKLGPEYSNRASGLMCLKCADELERALKEDAAIQAEPDESRPWTFQDLRELLTTAEAALAREADPAVPQPIAGKTPQQWAAWLDDIDQIEGCYATSNGATVIRQLQQQIATLSAERDSLAKLIQWALGEGDTEFPLLPDDWPKRKFYWRHELRQQFEAI